MLPLKRLHLERHCDSHLSRVPRSHHSSRLRGILPPVTLAMAMREAAASIDFTSPLKTDAPCPPRTAAANTVSVEVRDKGAVIS